MNDVTSQSNGRHILSTFVARKLREMLRTHRVKWLQHFQCIIIGILMFIITKEKVDDMDTCVQQS